LNCSELTKVEKVNIGGVDIGIYSSKGHLLNTLYGSFMQTGCCQIAIAINPEKVILSLRNKSISSIIEQCDVKYADGIGIVKAIKQKTGEKIPRIPGCELWESLMEYAGKNKIPAFLVGGTIEVIEKTKDKLFQEYQTPIVGYQDGFFNEEAKLITDIQNSGAEIVTVAMGSPRQEKFIFSCRAAGINAIFMGVGGTYDVYTGNVKRAPLIWRKIGCEWLYRLLSQPTRWKRQVNLIHFAWLYFTNRL
jgi:UDP-N-acetyl-D-mannosaminouronate:lipid I N-acetyl-D-mannosaminouronosyltransferase